MSQLSYTVSFVRMGRSPFASKAKDVPVFAQHLTGGSELTIFSNLDSPGIDLRVRQQAHFSAVALMAGFAVVEPRLPLADDALATAQRLRKAAEEGEVEIAEIDARTLAEAVSGLDITVVVNDYAGELTEFDLLDLAWGDWIVMAKHFEWVE